MKEKIFSAIVIILAIFAIIYKLKFTSYENVTTTKSESSANTMIEENTNTDNENYVSENTTNEDNSNLENIAIGSFVENKNMESKEKNEIIKVTSENFEEEVLKSEKIVIVDFYADWCGPCTALAPILEEIAEENADIKICKLDVDVEQKLAMDYGAQYLPTLLIMKNGEVINRIVGLQEKDYILEKCK